MINLLPEDIKETQEYGRKNHIVLNWIITSLFGVFILLSIAVIGRISIQTAKDQALSHKEDITQQLKAASHEEISDQYSSYVDGLSSTRKLYNQQVLYTRLIRKLGILLPTGARLTNITLSDKDKALGLNFENTSSELASVIQINLTDQSQQVADKTYNLFTNNFKLPVIGPIDTTRTDGQGTVTFNKDERKVSFYTTVSEDALTPDPGTLGVLNYSSKSSGDLAFASIADSLTKSGVLNDYREILTAKVESKKKGQSLESYLEDSPTPSIKKGAQIIDYTVSTKNKSIDFLVSADSLVEAKVLESVLLSAPDTSFIETYTFEDTSHANKDKCINQFTKQSECDAICRDGTSQCSLGTKKCLPTTDNGCRFILRAYYDELFKTFTARKVTPAESDKCKKEMTRSCTHFIEATYSQLFSKADINRVASCTTDATTSTVKCPVEMRAEFSEDAKFYLMSGASK